MKKSLFIVIAFVAALSSRAETIKFALQNEQVDTLPTNQLIPFLEQMDVESYYGKPVDSFLLAIPANLYNIRVYGSGLSKGTLFNASYLTADFTPSVYGPGVKIYVTVYTHLTRYSATGTWDANLFRKETIHHIDVYKNQNDCINGACLE